MGKLALIGAVIIGLTGAISTAAQAHPVTPARAAAAISTDKWDWGQTPPSVNGCAAYRYGTLCTVTMTVCFHDAVFGASAITSTNRVWVSVTHKRLGIAILPGINFDVAAGTPGCVPGDVPASRS